jgi:hypothetical protein
MDNDRGHISLPLAPPESGGIDAAVAEVLEAELERAVLRQDAPVPRESGGGPLAWIGLLILTVLSAYLWSASPGFLNAPIPEPPLALLDAGIRMEVGLQALKIEDFLQREGRLPNSLAEAGGPFSRVSYQRLDAYRYLLSLPGPQGVVFHSSSTPLERFLGNSRAVIREGGR